MDKEKASPLAWQGACAMINSKVHMAVIIMPTTVIEWDVSIIQGKTGNIWLLCIRQVKLVVTS